MKLYPAADVTLVEASGGLFEVQADSKIIFSSRRVNRAPRNSDEVVKELLERFPVQKQPGA